MCTQMEDVKPTKDNSFEANTYDGEKKKGIKNTSGYLCENHVPYVNTYTCYKNNLHFAVAHSSWSRHFYAWHIRKISLDDLFLSF